MRTTKAKPSRPSKTVEAAAYQGKQTRLGNSLGFRFEGALFRSHPEFNGEVTAHVIAPGHMLVTAQSKRLDRGDPVMASFLAFIGNDIAQSPQTMRELDSGLMDRIERLTAGVEVSSDEALGDEALL